MKLIPSKSSLLAYASGTLLLLGFSIPLVIAQIPASNTSGDCQISGEQHLNSTDDFMNMGKFQEDCQKDIQAAISSYTQAIRLSPKFEEAYYARGNAHYKLGNYKAAVEDYTQIISQKSTDSLGNTRQAYLQRSRAYEKLDEKQKAISDLNKVIGDSSPNPDEYFFRANLYRDLGNKENAISDYKKAENLLEQGLNGVFGTGPMNPIYQSMLDKVRNELSNLGVSLAPPQLTTRSILQSIAKTEVERALNLARLNPQHPTIQHFDAQLQELYKQLANTQPQPYKGVVQILVSNAAYQKIENLDLERSQLIKKFSPDNPAIVLIDNQKNQLEALIRRNKR